MRKYRRYKNRLEMFLSSEKGKRVLNFLYSWGASIVILGALFKLLHLPYANQILFVAMITESIVFFISAFEHPNKEYHWEDVFPVLKSKNPIDNTDSNVFQTSGATDPRSNVHGNGSLNINGNLEITEGEANNISNGIEKLSAAANQISNMADITEATHKYMDQLSILSQNMEHFSKVTESLTNVSDNLLNTYELHLKSVTTQIESIEHINSCLSRIREMHESSVVDSSIFKSETERMARQLSELNQVYSRLLQAMTINMGYQQPYGYQQQAPYSNNPMK